MRKLQNVEGMEHFKKWAKNENLFIILRPNLFFIYGDTKADLAFLAFLASLDFILYSLRFFLFSFPFKYTSPFPLPILPFLNGYFESKNGTFFWPSVTRSDIGFALPL